MSRAFVKDDDGGTGAEELPDRLISHHRNLVTAHGLRHIDCEIAGLQSAYAQAQNSADRISLQKIARELRYWTARRSSAEVQPAPAQDNQVHFGSKVTIARDDGRTHTYVIVGEDEANPAKGTLSYVSPWAQVLLGKSTGDEVRAGETCAQITEIS